MSTDLFGTAGERDRARAAPLPDRLRPRALGEVVGQDHLVGPGQVLTRMAEERRLRSLVLYGTPGSGKTTIARLLAAAVESAFVPLSAVEAGVAEVRRVVEGARERWRLEGRGTVVFLDEIHRFNKAQQDVLLPHVETGTLTLMGATAENPWVTIIPALLSRCLLLQVKPLTRDDVVVVLRRALERRAEWRPDAQVAEDVLTAIANRAGGDARLALNLLDWTFLLTPPGEVADEERVGRVWKEAPHYHDRAGDRHYDRISALIKSLRGSDPDAALFWFGLMLAGGEDPEFVSRRLMIHAAEDVGMADPRALLVAVAAHQALMAVGLPEARIPLAEALIYIATAPKSNSVVDALARLDQAVSKHPDAAVPLALQSPQYKGGAVAGYRYPHDAPGHFLPDAHLPPELGELGLYRGSDQGEEPMTTARVSAWRSAREAFARAAARPPSRDPDADGGDLPPG